MLYNTKLKQMAACALGDKVQNTIGSSCIEVWENGVCVSSPWDPLENHRDTLMLITELGLSINQQPGFVKVNKGNIAHTVFIDSYTDKAAALSQATLMVSALIWEQQAALIEVNQG